MSVEELHHLGVDWAGLFPEKILRIKCELEEACLPLHNQIRMRHSLHWLQVPENGEATRITFLFFILHGNLAASSSRVANVMFATAVPRLIPQGNVRREGYFHRHKIYKRFLETF